MGMPRSLESCRHPNPSRKQLGITRPTNQGSALRGGKRSPLPLRNTEGLTSYDLRLLTPWESALRPKSRGYENFIHIDWIILWLFGLTASWNHQSAEIFVESTAMRLPSRLSIGHRSKSPPSRRVFFQVSFVFLIIFFHSFFVHKSSNVA